MNRRLSFLWPPRITKPIPCSLALGVAIIVVAGAGCPPSTLASGPLSWEQLPPLPDAEGFAAPFAGVHNGALLVAGGANFPRATPWEGGTKVWYDSVFVLQKPNGTWSDGGKLPRPLAYGVSITTDRGVACLGGSGSERHYDECFLMRWENGQAHIVPLPRLPRPCANAAGVLLDNKIYVAGGIKDSTSITAMKTFWALDLLRLDDAWQSKKPWPGPARMLATMGAHGGSVYLFSGANLKPDRNGKPVRQWLHDAYRYTPGNG